MLTGSQRVRGAAAARAADTHNTYTGQRDAECDVRALHRTASQPSEMVESLPVATRSGPDSSAGAGSIAARVGVAMPC